jgi:hypothetical protein
MNEDTVWLIGIFTVVGCAFILLIFISTYESPEQTEANEWLENTSDCEDMRMYIMADPKHEIVKKYYYQTGSFWDNVMDKYKDRC